MVSESNMIRKGVNLSGINKPVAKFVNDVLHLLYYFAVKQIIEYNLNVAFIEKLLNLYAHPKSFGSNSHLVLLESTQLVLSCVF